jgi:hypothetical protein
MDILTICKQVWAIAHHTIIQALRMKIVLVIVAFLAVLLMAMPFFLQADDSPVGRVRMVLTYSLYLTTFLLSILTLFLSVSVFWNEIKGRQILMLDPKPMARATLLLGKWVGVMIINVCLLAIMLTITYMLIRFYVGRRPPGISDEGWQAFYSQTFYATSVARPEHPEGLSARVEEIVQEKIKNDQVPKGYSVEWLRQQTMSRLLKGAWEVPVGNSKTWNIYGIPKPEENGLIHIRFRHNGMIKKDRVLIRGRFEVNKSGDTAHYIPEMHYKTAAELQRALREDKTLSIYAGRLCRYYRANVSASHIFPVTTDLIQTPDPLDPSKNYVEFSYYNMGFKNQTKSSAHIPYMTGVEVHYPAGRLWSNMFRAGVIVLFQMALLTIMGICFATFLSYPVAILATMTIFVAGQLLTWIIQSVLGDVFIFGTSVRPPWAVTEGGDIFIRHALMWCATVLFPNINPSGVIEQVSMGLFIPGGAVYAVFVQFIVIRVTLVALVAWLVYRKRQLAILSRNA